MEHLQGIRDRAKLADSQISELESILKSLVQKKCQKYRYKVLYYRYKNRGNFARLLFEEAGIPYENITNRKEVLTHFTCKGTLSKDNADISSYDLFAPPAVIRYPIDPESNEETIALSQTVPLVSFLSQELNLCPSTLEDHYRQQMLCANANDILNEIRQHKDDAYEDLNAFFTGRMQIWLDILEKPLKSKPNQKYYFEDRCLAADIAVYNICEGIIDIMDKREQELFIITHPILHAHYLRIKHRNCIKLLVDKQTKENYEWWPSRLGFAACRDRLNGRENMTNNDEDAKLSVEPETKTDSEWKVAEEEELKIAAEAVKMQVQTHDMVQEQGALDVFEVVSGSKQSADGTNYRIRMRIGETTFVQLSVCQSKAPVKYELKDVLLIHQTTEIPQLGAWGNTAELDEMTEVSDAIKSEIEQQANDFGKEITMFEIEDGRKQVESGMNFKVKLKVDTNRWCVVLVYRSLPPFTYSLKRLTWIEGNV